MRKASLFLPLIFCIAASLTFSSISQQATQGSVLTRANERSSFRGLKSFFFCFESCRESQVMVARSCTEVSTNCQAVYKNLPSMVRCISVFAAPSVLLTVWLLKMVISRRTVTDDAASGNSAIFVYCCHRWHMRSTERNTSSGCRLGSSFGSANSRRAIALCHGFRCAII